MKFYIFKEAITGTLKFHGEFTQLDLVRLKLTTLDQALLDDVGGGTDTTASDYLLALEMLFRRAQEQNKKGAAA